MAPPIIDACAKEDLDRVKKLLEDPTLDINATDDRGRSAFWYAVAIAAVAPASNRKMEIIIELLKHPKLDIFKKDNEGKDPVYIAEKLGKTPFLKELIPYLQKAQVPLKKEPSNIDKLREKVHVITHVKIGEEILRPSNTSPSSNISAIQSNQPIARKKLTTLEQIGHLIEACEQNQPQNIEEILKEIPNLVNGKIKNGETALEIVCRNGHVEALQVLIKYVDRNKVYDDGKTIIQKLNDYSGKNQARMLQILEQPRAVQHAQANTQRTVSSVTPASSQSAQTISRLDSTGKISTYKSAEDWWNEKPVLAESVESHTHRNANSAATTTPAKSSVTNTYLPMKSTPMTTEHPRNASASTTPLFDKVQTIRETERTKHYTTGPLAKDKDAKQEKVILNPVPATSREEYESLKFTLYRACVQDKDQIVNQILSANPELLNQHLPVPPELAKQGYPPFQTPLHIASILGNEQVFEALIGYKELQYAQTDRASTDNAGKVVVYGEDKTAKEKIENRLKTDPTLAPEKRTQLTRMQQKLHELEKKPSKKKDDLRSKKNNNPKTPEEMQKENLRNACLGNDVKEIQAILKKYPDFINLPLNKNSETALHLVCQTGNVEALHALMQYPTLNYQFKRDQSIQTPLDRLLSCMENINKFSVIAQNKIDEINLSKDGGNLSFLKKHYPNDEKLLQSEKDLTTNLKAKANYKEEKAKIEIVYKVLLLKNYGFSELKFEQISFVENKLKQLEKQAGGLKQELTVTKQIISSLDKSLQTPTNSPSEIQQMKNSRVKMYNDAANLTGKLEILQKEYTHLQNFYDILLEKFPNAKLQKISVDSPRENAVAKLKA
jgi:ankyrin repeat protein